MRQSRLRCPDATLLHNALNNMNDSIRCHLQAYERFVQLMCDRPDCDAKLLLARAMQDARGYRLKPQAQAHRPAQIQAHAPASRQAEVQASIDVVVLTAGVGGVGRGDPVQCELCAYGHVA